MIHLYLHIFVIKLLTISLLNNQLFIQTPRIISPGNVPNQQNTNKVLDLNKAITFKRHVIVQSREHSLPGETQ